jgi:hypothetical protein
MFSTVYTMPVYTYEWVSYKRRYEPTRLTTGKSIVRITATFCHVDFNYKGLRYVRKIYPRTARMCTMACFT